MNTAGKQELIRITNQNLILNLIREKGLISRADIAKLLNLSPPSTSSNINRLLNMEMIREVGEGVSSGGRKPILLELNKEYGFIIAVDMSSEEVRISLGNICAEIIDGFYFKLNEDGDGIRILISIINNINTLLDKNGVEKDKIKIIAIGTPGVYDRQSHRFLSSRISNWQDIDAVGALKTEYNAPVLIKNDIAMACLGEYIFGLKKSCGNMIYINVDSRIGAGLILDGKLYEGCNGAAGLINSMAFSKEQIGGIFKRNGYLETTVSVDKLVQKIRNLCKNDKTVLDLCGGDINKLDFGMLKRAYERNHLVIKGELDRVVDLIAIAIGNINTVLDIDTIILGGRMATLGEYFLLSIKRIIGELCPFTPYITHSVLKDNSITYGLFAAGQQSIFDEIAKI